MLGCIRQEILSGVRSENQFQILRDHFRAFPDEVLQTGDYERAAEFFNDCRRKGLQGSNTDFLICAAAANRGQRNLHDPSRLSAVSGGHRYYAFFPSNGFVEQWNAAAHRIARETRQTTRRPGVLLFASGTRPVFYFLNIGQRDQPRNPVPIVHHNECRDRRVFLFGYGRKIDKIGMVDRKARTRSGDDHKRSELSRIDNLSYLFPRHTKRNSAIDATVFQRSI